MAQEVFEKFGSYILLDRIGSGGMAHIFRARPASCTANGRVLVIKRILPEIAETPMFLNMFRSEIQVAMGFSHPNTVHIYRFGEIEDQAYYAMEYIEGIDLKQLIVHFGDQRQTVPIEITLSVIEAAARGLHYAHTFENNATGLVYRVVHRDVSPQNILISYDGGVKVIDFGIAKAALTSAESTRGGIIKGKAGYLSPEQASQQPVDARADVFSLGIVLWEMLTGRKLFYTPGNNELETLELVQNCERVVVPPSRINPKISPTLDALVLKALAKERECRFSSAEEMQNALHAMLTATNPGFGPSELGRQIRLLFHEKCMEERKQLQKLNSKAQAILEAERTKAKSSETKIIYKPQSDPAPVKSIPTENLPSLKLEKHANAKSFETPRKRQAPPPPSRTLDVREFFEGLVSTVKQKISRSSSSSRAPALEFTGRLKSKLPKSLHEQAVERLNQYTRLPMSRRAGILIALLAFVFIKVDERLFLLDDFFQPKQHYKFAQIERTAPLGSKNRTAWLRLVFAPAGKLPRAAWINAQPVDLHNPVVAISLDKPVKVSVETGAHKGRHSIDSNNGRIEKKMVFASRDYPAVNPLVSVKVNLTPTKR